MKFLTASLLAAVLCLPASAAIVSNPVLFPDSQTVDSLSPGLGRPVLAIPGSIWEVWWNDNTGRGDFDFNDLVGVVAFNWIDPTTVQGIAGTFIGSNSGASNALYAPGGTTLLHSTGGGSSLLTFGPIPTGSEVILEMISGVNGATVFTGPASRNADGEIHAWTTEITGIPEPSTYALVGIGLAAIALLRRRSRS